jgi:hypothetical protein
MGTCFLCVFLHRLWLSSAMWQPQIERLSKTLPQQMRWPLRCNKCFSEAYQLPVSSISATSLLAPLATTIVDLCD